MYCDGTDSSGFDHDSLANTAIKKESKNKPFDGRGIGYHHGKAMVIELPAVKTFQLDSNLPAYYAFDDIDKFKDFYEDIPYIRSSLRNKELDDRKPASFLNPNNNYNLKPEQESKNYSDIINTNESHKSDLSQKNDSKESNDLDDDLKNAFDRLAKLVKDRISKNKINDSKIKSYDQDIKLPNKTSLSNEKLYDMKTSKEFIDRLHNINKSTDPDDSSLKDSFYGTAYPFKKRYEIKQNDNSHISYEPKHNLPLSKSYINLYYPVTDAGKGDAIKAHKYIFEDSTTDLEDDEWHNKDDLDNTPLRYNHKGYIYKGPYKSSIDKNSKKPGYSGEKQKSEKYTPLDESVPTSKVWFDGSGFTPTRLHESDYSSESDEDKR